jgi:hypothetical protein
MLNMNNAGVDPRKKRRKSKTRYKTRSNLTKCHQDEEDDDEAFISPSTSYNINSGFNVDGPAIIDTIFEDDGSRQKIKYEKLRENTIERVKIVHVDGPSSLWVRRVSDTNRFSMLMNEIDDYVKHCDANGVAKGCDDARIGTYVYTR